MKKMYVLIGNYGSGKTELALNRARAAGAAARDSRGLSELRLLRY